jgi:hypothetical protein
MRALRLLPVLIMLGGIALVATFGASFAQQLMTRVKVLITGMEVMNIGEELRFHYLSTGTVPGVEEPEEFKSFLRSSFTPYVGSRDPAEDLFGNAFQLVLVEEDGEVTPHVLSPGPNGAGDGCRLLNGRTLPESEALRLGDDICVALAHALRDTPYVDTRR